MSTAILSPRRTDTADTADTVEDDLADLAARMVATWPRLSDDRKRELGALLASS